MILIMDTKILQRLGESICVVPQAEQKTYAHNATAHSKNAQYPFGTREGPPGEIRIYFAVTNEGSRKEPTIQASTILRIERESLVSA